jgi:CheY-like chemotaxis protein
MEAIGTVAGGVAHDLNNLLSPMLLARALLGDRLAKQEDREILDTVHHAAHRAAAIVKQLLAFSRGEEGERHPVEVSLLFREIASFLRETFPREITVAASAQRGLWAVVAEPTQIHQVLMNLCVNARDAMPQGGTLSLTAQNVELSETEAQLNPRAHAGPYVLITVADNGSGIPPAIVERIFDPFFTTKGLGRGTGLGLSTVAGIVKSHAGFVTVYSEPGAGSSFSVYLPASVNVAPLKSDEPSEAGPNGNQELILVVDDEFALSASLRQLLIKRNYRVLVANNGREGIATFERHPEEIRLVITDTMMPVMGGLQMVRELRRLHPGLPIIAATGLEQEEKRREYHSLNVPDVLLKPCDADDLLRAIRRSLDRPVPSP